MNQYTLYCQESHQSIARLEASCRNVFNVFADSTELAFKTITQLMATKRTFAVIDPNGAVILADLAINKCIFDKDGRVTINVFQLQRILD
jgi:hypothetical protein